MASTISGVKVGSATSNGMPASVTAAIRKGVPKHQALTMGPKPVSDVKVGR